MKPVFLIYCILAVNLSQAQIITPVIEPGEIRLIALPKDSTGQANKINICNIKIIDARDDTSSVGYLYVRRKIKKVILSNGMENDLGVWYEKYLRTNKQYKSGMSLVINIRKLRLSERAIPSGGNNRLFDQISTSWKEGILTK